jgi:two-component system, NarL family, sensor histidine kinase UhpB
MLQVAKRSSRYAHLFVSLNLLMLLVFFASSSVNFRTVESTRIAYERLVRDWFSLRLSLRGEVDGATPRQDLLRFSEGLSALLTSELLESASMLSQSLAEAGNRLSAAWDRVRPVLERQTLESSHLVSLFEDALLDLESLLAEFVNLQLRALTILLYFLGATIAGAVGIFILVEREHEQSRRAAVEVQSFARSTLGGLERERLRISRALHDSLGQELSLALLEVGELESGRSSPGATQLKRRLRNAIDWIRDLAHDLHPAEIDEGGLAVAIRSYCAELSCASDTDIRWFVDDELGEIRRDVAINVYRVAQEAITNALRHGDPRSVTVRVSRTDDGLVLVVDDDGRGFHRDGRAGGGRPGGGRHGIGLIGIRERASMLGAALEIETEPGAGTRVRLDVPRTTLQNVEET